MSRIICQGTPKVKPTRTTPRRPGRFGAGILAYVPSSGRLDYTDADYAWYLANVVAVAESGPSGAELDRLADESEAVALMERGIRPF